MAISKASAQWNGSLKDGKGVMKPAHAPEVAFTLGTRFEGKEGSNPEEIIGAALAGCFSMALSAELGKAGFTPQSVKTSAQVHMDKDAQGFVISKIELSSTANVPGIDAAKLEEIAQATKKGCPVSRALAATPITLVMSLG